MIHLNIKFDKKKLPHFFQDGVKIPDNFFVKPLQRAAKVGVDKARTETKNEISSQYTLPSSTIGKTSETRHFGDGAQMRLDRTTNDFLGFKGVKFKKMPLGAKGRNLVPAVVEIKKDNKFDYDRILAGTMQKGQKRIGVYKKDENRRNVFRRYIGPSTRGIFNANENVSAPVFKEAMDKFYKEFERLVYLEVFK